MLKDTLPKRIRKAREDRKLSRQKLAMAIGVSSQSVYEWETGRTFPGLERLDALSLVLGRPASWFLDVSTEEEARPFRLRLLTLEGEEAPPEAVAQVRELVRVAGLGTLSECYQRFPNRVRWSILRAPAVMVSRPAA